MSETVYQSLLEVMKKRGGNYAGMNVPEFFAMVEVLFTPEEAEINNAMPRGPFTAAGLAEGLGREAADVEAILEGMANKGLCMAIKKEGVQYYQSARFMPGILEFQFMAGGNTARDKEIAELIHAYEKVYDARVGERAINYPTSRVITVDQTIEAGNRVNTYDQVQNYIDKYDAIAVSTCFCRHAASLRGEDTHDLPNDVCMQFGMGAQYAVDRLGARMVSKEEARKVLDKAEEAGLIHMSQNVTEDIGFLWNCDRYHCVAVKSALTKSKPGLFFNSGFDPKFDPELCVACETCIDRCPPQALTMGEDDVPVVDFDLCFGCAVCATGCPEEAIAMVNKPGFPLPPKDGKELKAAIKASMG